MIAITIIILIIFILLVSSFFKIILNPIKPNKQVYGCTQPNCISPKCIGHDCQCDGCIGDKCIAGDCYGESCKAGDCSGVNCKAGDCYGSDCTPGICTDPTCEIGTCPQESKKCIDGQKLQIKKENYLKNMDYFPKNTLFHPPLCRDFLSLNDMLKGRAKNLQFKRTSFNSQTETEEKYIRMRTDPPTFKNGNCDICIRINNTIKCN